LINPQVVRESHLAAVLAIDEAVEKHDLERNADMRLLGGTHRSPGGPPLRAHEESITYLAQGLAAALERIEHLEERIEELEAHLFVKEEVAEGSLEEE
jgi:hypothetical protein